METKDKEEVKAVLQTVLAIAEAIRELGSIPSGHLYARLTDKLSLDAYNSIIRTLVNAKLVKEHDSHMLEWIGSKLEAKQS